MANKFTNRVLGLQPTIAVVMEDSIWEYGKEKEKAKINIEELMILQEPGPATKKVRVTNGKVGQIKVEKTQNFIEMYLPDSLYTYPKEGEMEEADKQLFGAKKTTMKFVDSESKKMIRIVEAKTKLTIFVINGELKEENIKILGKYDDFDKNAKGKKEKHKNGLSPKSKEAALR